MQRAHILNLIIKTEQCTACRACELACSFSKEGHFGPAFSRIRVMQIHELGMNVPIVCMNCADAPCIPACPTGAVYRDTSVPVVRINEEECIGCGACVTACPFGAAEMNEERGVAMMCDLCAGQPACVEHCIYGALRFDRARVTGRVKRLAVAHGLATRHRRGRGEKHDSGSE